jgi:hypothetical protein
MRLIGNVDKITRTYVAGWRADAENPDKPVDVLIYVNDEGRGRITADLARDDLRAAFPGATGKHGFRFEFGWPLSPFRANDVRVIDQHDRGPLPGGERTLPARVAPQRSDPLPVCVTSTGRAGTSLLMGRLAAHPEIAVAGAHPYEVKQLEYQVLALRTLTLEANWDRSMGPDGLTAEMSRYLVGFNPFNHPQFGDDGLLDRYWEVTGPSILSPALRDMVLAYYDAVRAMTAKVRVRYFAEKAHPNRLLRDGIVAMFGGLKEIVLVRDPRDLVCSYRSFWGSNPAASISLIRAQFVELAERVRLGQGDTLLVRYEDLVMEPESTLGTIFDFLDLDHSTAARQEAEAAIFSRHGTSGSPQASIGRWRQELTADEQLLFAGAFDALLPTLGYAPS